MDSFFFRELQLVSLTFNSCFLYELKYKVRLSKNIWGIFHFRFRFVFIIFHIFIQQKAWTIWLKNIIIPFKVEITEAAPPKVFLGKGVAL